MMIAEVEIPPPAICRVTTYWPDGSDALGVYVVNPLPFGLDRNVFGASFAPVGSVTVCTTSTPCAELGNPVYWKTKLVPRTPRGTARTW